MYALSDGMNDGGYEILDCEGGYYLSYVFRDGDDDERVKAHAEAMAYLAQSDLFEEDSRPNHYGMGHIITPHEIFLLQGWAQMEALIPIKLKTQEHNI